MKPEYWIVKINNRTHWSKEIQNQTTNIWAVYAFNRAEVTRICSPYTNYFCHFLGHDYDPTDNLTDEDKDTLSEDIITEFSENDYYFTNTIEPLLNNSAIASNITNLLDLEDIDEDDENPFDLIREGWNTGALIF